MPPPFETTEKVLRELGRIERLLGRLDGLAVTRPQPHLRKRNRVRSLRASTAIEGNALNEAQVTAVLEGRRVLGRPDDITEILNANAAYDRLEHWQGHSLESLLAAHATLMRGLLQGAGKLRTGGVGIFRGETLARLAPPAHLVHHLVTRLLGWVRRSEQHPLVIGCIAHYELLFIHPFLDGNGRLARLWQQVIHRRVSPLLQYVPVESVIRERQAGYYRCLRACDRRGDATAFLEFALTAVADSLTTFAQEVRPAVQTATERLAAARAHLARRWFSRADYLRLHPRLSTATASRDLAQAVARKQVRRQGTQRLARYRFT